MRGRNYSLRKHAGEDSTILCLSSVGDRYYTNNETNSSLTLVAPQAMMSVMTASPAVAALQQKPPSAVEIDRLAVQFLDLEKKVDQAYKIAVELDEPYERLKEQLIDVVEEFGSMHAEKSKLLHGTRYEIMATFGMSTSIDAAAAERFAIALRDAKQTRLLNRIFDQQIRYTLTADPETHSWPIGTMQDPVSVPLFSNAPMSHPPMSSSSGRGLPR